MTTATRTGEIPKTEDRHYRGLVGILATVLGLAVTVGIGAGFVAVIGALG